jgi:hypothetical protein
MPAEIKVLSSIATREAYLELVPQFERTAGHKVTTAWAGTVDIMKRMASGEQHEVVMISSKEMEELIQLAAGWIWPAAASVSRCAPALRSPISAQAMRSSERCWPPRRSATPAVRAACTWRTWSSAWASPPM